MKIFLTLIPILLSVIVKSQITYDSSISVPWNFYEVNTTSAGQKFFAVNQNADILTIYNSDFSLYKTIDLPAGYQYANMSALDASGSGILSLNDKLFNADASLEFLAYANVPANSEGILSVIDENANIVYTFPDTIWAGSVSLFTVGTEFKLGYIVASGDNATTNMKIFNLPGSLPCNQCNYTAAISGPESGSGIGALSAYPNPFTNNLTVSYNLSSKQNAKLVISDVTGRELKSIVLNNASDKLQINTADLAHGVVILSLYGENQHLVSKKLVKIE